MRVPKKTHKKSVTPAVIAKPDPPMTLERFFRTVFRQYKSAEEEFNKELSDFIERLETSRTSTYSDVAGGAIRSHVEDVAAKEATKNLLREVRGVVNQCFSVEELFDTIGSLREILHKRALSQVRGSNRSTNGFSNAIDETQTYALASYLRWEFDSYFFFQIKRMYEERDQTREANDRFALQRVLNRMSQDELLALVQWSPSYFVRQAADSTFVSVAMNTSQVAQDDCQPKKRIDRVEDPTIGFPLTQTFRPSDPEIKISDTTEFIPD